MIYVVGGSGSSGNAGFATRHGPNVGISNPTRTHYLNSSAFVRPPTIGDGTGFGNLSKNFMTAPGFSNTDFPTAKAFPIRARWSLASCLICSTSGNPGSNASSPGSLGVISVHHGLRSLRSSSLLIYISIEGRKME
jgi:hypothetical protein